VAAAPIVGAGLAGSWAIGLLVLVGQVAGEVSGPSTILALVIAAITAVLTGDFQLFYSCFHGNPQYQLLRNHTPDPRNFSLLNILDWRLPEPSDSKNVIMNPMGLGIKNHCAGEGQHQFI
jgi:hypothetical protein